ncbi:MAG: dihydroorotase, partial [Candidatus Diapherotrites archaeon]|nr:dihydroorotase [Candidatus Diapherotrites archaeon]
GITTVLDMPNNSPPVIDTQTLENKRKIIAQKSKINFGLFFGATESNLLEIEKAENICGIKVYYGSSTGNLLVNSHKILKKIFQIAAKKQVTVAVHAEDEKLMKKNLEKFKNEKNPTAKIHSMIRSMECEEKAIKDILKTHKGTKCTLHFCHITTRKGIELIFKAKKNYKKISFEVSPHHLFLDEEKINVLGNFGKINPPLRDKSETNFLLKMLKKGKIDCIATDHAPHTIEEKEKNYFDAPSGVTGLETALSLLLDAGINPEIIAKTYSENPAKIFGLKNKGLIKEGFDSDLIIVNPEKEWIINNSELETKCKWSPFNGWKLKGKTAITIVGGKIKFQNK